MPETPTNFIGRHKGQAAWFTFVALSVSVPAYVFSNFDKLVVREKTVPQWLSENGWGWPAVVKFILLWLAASAILSLTVYGILSGLSWLIDKKNSVSKLEVTFKNEPPYTDDSGPSGLGLYYKNRRIGVTSSVDGKVSVKVPTVRLENGQIRSNIFLRPTDNQPEEVDAGDPGYWRVVQWNTSEKSIKLVHMGKDSYYLGPESRFEIVAKCAGLSRRKWVITKIEGDELLFKLSDKADDNFTVSERKQGREHEKQGQPPKPKLQGKIICLDVNPTLTFKFEDELNDCFLILCLKVTNETVPTMVSRWQLDLLWEGVEYPSARHKVEGYYVKRPSAHAADRETRYETEKRGLTEFPNDEEITNTNYKVGWVRFWVGSLPSQAIVNGRRLRKEVTLRLQALDSKDGPHLIYKGTTTGLPGCGTIERPQQMAQEN